MLFVMMSFTGAEAEIVHIDGVLNAGMKQKINDWLNDVTGKKDYKRYGEKERRKKRIAGQLFTMAVSLAAGYYLIWCIINTQWQYWYMAVPFLITESAFLLLFLLWANVLWNKRYHRPNGHPLEKKDFAVDIFIPVCGESIEVIEQTVSAAISIDYNNKKIYLLDDDEDDAVEKLSKKKGVEYIRRSAYENRKAGNLNYALKHTKGDLILAIDADQVAKSEIIHRIIGYFTLPKIAFVQTKETFKLPKGDPWGNGDEVFYNVMQPGKNYDNAAILCGSGVMYRRTALESIAYETVTSISRCPVMISETASCETGGDKGLWITKAFNALKLRFKRVEGIIWFDIDKESVTGQLHLLLAH